MNLKTIYIKLVSAFTIVVMLWNVLGWMGLNEVLEHTHSDTENSYCTMNYCTCLVEHEDSVCTCHHHNDDERNEDEFLYTVSKYCFYDSPHSDTPSFSIGIVLHDYNGYFGLAKSPVPRVLENPFYLSDTHLSNLLLAKNLLRPPIS